ncbi:MAG: fumarylacetoacetate hydrolase family protein [Elusimicrobia bacterium]|nr:fumarylacetoacetate hydrolase family protein [Candidatus Liberimonas magnetica]
MIYLRFLHDGHIKHGVLLGKTVHEITPNYFVKYKKTGKKYPLKKIKLLAPVQPGKIIALGLNYLEHAQELKMSIPFEPLMFLKAPTSVVGPCDDISYPESSIKVDYEAELAIVIKKKAKNVPEKKVKDYILGYTCFNDVTARDLQKKDGQWTRAKSFDTFAPIGPWIVDDINPGKLKIETYLNGKRCQRSNTSDLIFKIEEIVHFVSTVMTLLPGDVIATGTPPGVGPMKRKDKVEVRIEKIGALKNRVV